MSASKALFLQLRRTDQIESLLKKINIWFNIALYTGPYKDFKVQSLQHVEQAFELTFTALNPTVGACYIRFQIDEVIYQIDGELLLQNGSYVFNYKDFSRELKRQILRLEVPENYQAQFILNSAAGQAVNEETKLMDIHTDGFLFASWNPLFIKAGDLIRGQIKIAKFNEVQVAGVVRHCIKKDGRIFVGVELHHHEFGTEDKMADLMTAYKRDVKSRASS